MLKASACSECRFDPAASPIRALRLELAMNEQQFWRRCEVRFTRYNTSRRWRLAIVAPTPWPGLAGALHLVGRTHQRPAGRRPSDRARQRWGEPLHQQDRLDVPQGRDSIAVRRRARPLGRRGPRRALNPAVTGRVVSGFDRFDLDLDLPTGVEEFLHHHGRVGGPDVPEDLSVRRSHGIEVGRLHQIDAGPDHVLER